MIKSIDEGISYCFYFVSTILYFDNGVFRNSYLLIEDPRAFNGVSIIDILAYISGDDNFVQKFGLAPIEICVLVSFYITMAVVLVFIKVSQVRHLICRATTAWCLFSIVYYVVVNISSPSGLIQGLSFLDRIVWLFAGYWYLAFVFRRFLSVGERSPILTDGNSDIKEAG